MVRKHSDHNVTRERLIQTGVELFSSYGYEGTTARMISDHAETNIASMSFWFGNKEGYYNAVVEYAVNQLAFSFDDLKKQTEAVYGNGTPDKEQIFSLITLYVMNCIGIVSKYGDLSKYVTLVSRKAPKDVVVTDSAAEYSKATTDMMVNLLCDYWGTDDRSYAAVIARTIYGSIISYGEHPGFTKNTLHQDQDDTEMEKTWDILAEYILSGIRNHVVK